jgi:hypothetical protein
MNPEYLSRSILPTAYQLTRNTAFGKPNVNQSFTSEYHLPQVLLIFYKQEIMDKTDYLSMWNKYPATKLLYSEWRRLEHVDFSELRNLNQDWDSQIEIPQRLLDLRLACLMYYNLDVAATI